MAGVFKLPSRWGFPSVHEMKVKHDKNLKRDFPSLLHQMYTSTSFLAVYILVRKAERKSILVVAAPVRVRN